MRSSNHCGLIAYRHGITGQLCIFTPEEHKAYEEHCKITFDSLAPVGDYERQAAQSIVHDLWRLKRARSIEAVLVAQAGTSLEEADDLRLLRIYAKRIQRACNQNKAQFKILQTERKARAAEAMCTLNSYIN